MFMQKRGAAWLAEEHKNIRELLICVCGARYITIYPVPL